MEHLLEAIPHAVASVLELIAVLVIAWGGLHALGGVLLSVWVREASMARRKAIWLSFGMWLLLGLEFELAADIVRTTVTPTWTELGWLGAVAVIRTFLSFFLGKDLESLRGATSRETSQAERPQEQNGEERRIQPR